MLHRTAHRLVSLPVQRTNKRQVREYWTNFAYSGDPNKPRGGGDSGLANWPAHVMDTNLTLAIDVDYTVIKNIKGSRCDVWDAIGPIHPP